MPTHEDTITDNTVWNHDHTKSYSFGSRGRMPEWVHDGLENGTISDPRVSKEIISGLPYVTTDGEVCLVNPENSLQFYIFGSRGPRPHWVNTHIKKLQDQKLLPISDKWYQSFNGIENIQEAESVIEKEKIKKNESILNSTKITPPLHNSDWRVQIINNTGIIVNPDNHGEIYQIGSTGRKPKWLTIAEEQGYITVPSKKELFEEQNITPNTTTQQTPTFKKLDGGEVLYNPMNPSECYVKGQRGRKPRWVLGLLTNMGVEDEEDVTDDMVEEYTRDIIEPPGSCNGIFSWRYNGNGVSSQNPVYIFAKSVDDAVTTINSSLNNTLSQEDFKKAFSMNPRSVTAEFIRSNDVTTDIPSIWIYEIRNAKLGIQQWGKLITRK